MKKILNVLLSTLMVFTCLTANTVFADPVTPTANDFTYNKTTGVVSPTSGKDLGNMTTYYKAAESTTWTEMKPTAVGTYEVGIVTTGSTTYSAVGTTAVPFTNDWSYRIYAINKTGTTNGTFTLSSNTASEGTEITVSFSAADGYEVDTVSIKDSQNNDVSYADHKFTMPASDVNVAVTFKTASGGMETPNVVISWEDNLSYGNAIPSTLNYTVTIDGVADNSVVSLELANADYTTPLAASTTTFTSDLKVKVSYEVSTSNEADNIKDKVSFKVNDGVIPLTSNNLYYL